MYGFLELALAVVVVVTPFTFQLINGLYRGIYPTLEASPQALAVTAASRWPSWRWRRRRS